MCQTVLSENTVYYFFSTYAQVWSALIVFVVIALRDKLANLEKTCIEAFAEMKGIIEDTRISWKNTYPNLNNPSCCNSIDELRKAFKTDLPLVKEIDGIQDKALDVTGINHQKLPTVFVKGAEIKAKMKRAVILYDVLELQYENQGSLRQGIKQFLTKAFIILVSSLLCIVSVNIFISEPFGDGLFFTTIIALLVFSGASIKWFINLWLN